MIGVNTTLAGDTLANIEANQLKRLNGAIIADFEAVD